jgi:biotin-[acetyl-CoA-carboxylase] ligase BirA-like protein
MKANTATRILSHKIASHLPGVYDDVRSFVESNLEEIDFEYKDGEFFGLAMQRSSKLVKFLIDTYIKIELQKDPSSIEHIAAVRHKLKTILEQQISQSPYEFDELPSEIQEILAPWMPPEDVESEVDAEDFGDLEDDMYWHAIIADHQTSGIGSGDRKWHGGKLESVLVTYILPYFGDLSREQLSQVVSLSVKDTLESIGCPARIKWLNDVICGPKKISGNLVEIKDGAGGNKVCLIGVGINVNQDQENFDSQGLGSATSVKLTKATEADFSVPEIFFSLTKNLYYNFQIAGGFGYQKVRESIEDALAHLKHKVDVLDKTTNITHQGVFTAMADNGAMILTLDESGATIEIMNGSISNDLGMAAEGEIAPHGVAIGAESLVA